MENKENPNSHEALSRETSNSWSDLSLDLLSLVFERLSFANFQRAKSVCSSWYSASRQSVPKNQLHWLILFPESNNKNKCMLFNPEEKEKLYKTHDLGVEFAKCICLATYKSWLLMQDSQYNFFITNLFTRERIDLPSVELLWKEYEFRIARLNERRYVGINIQSPVFWIDDKTKDYVVLWGHKDLCVVYSKKRDNLWNQIPETFLCLNMVYKDHKLYFLSDNGIFKIFDFSGETPQETFQCGFLVERIQSSTKLLRSQPRNYSWVFRATYLVVTVAREVLKVEKWWRPTYRTWSFLVFKVYSSGLCLKKPERIKSLGDESILLEQGITVLAKDTDRITRNSIYYSGSGDLENTEDIFFFNLETEKTETQHTFDHTSVRFSSSKWFLPCFTHT